MIIGDRWTDLVSSKMSLPVHEVRKTLQEKDELVKSTWKSEKGGASALHQANHKQQLWSGTNTGICS